MNIGIDIDETITNNLEARLPHGQRYTMELRGDMNLSPDKTAVPAGEIFNLTPEQEKDFHEKHLEELLINANLKPFANKVINNLRAEGHKIFFITARSREKEHLSDPYKASADYLNKHKIEYDGLIVECFDKTAAYNRLNLDILIDDKADICQKVPNAILFDSPHNQGITGLKRVYSWIEVYFIISEEKWKN